MSIVAAEASILVPPLLLIPLDSIVANEASIPYVVSMEAEDAVTFEVNAEDTVDTVSMEGVLDNNGSFFGSDGDDVEPVASAANVDAGVEQTDLEVHEAEVNTERLSFKDENAKSNHG